MVCNPQVLRSFVRGCICEMVENQVVTTQILLNPPYMFAAFFLIARFRDRKSVLPCFQTPQSLPQPFLCFFTEAPPTKQQAQVACRQNLIPCEWPGYGAETASSEEFYDRELLQELAEAVFIPQESKYFDALTRFPEEHPTSLALTEAMSEEKLKSREKG